MQKALLMDLHYAIIKDLAALHRPVRKLANATGDVVMERKEKFIVFQQRQVRCTVDVL
jgi:hypothetical protein